MRWFCSSSSRSSGDSVRTAPACCGGGGAGGAASAAGAGAAASASAANVGSSSARAARGKSSAAPKASSASRRPQRAEAGGCRPLAQGTRAARRHRSRDVPLQCAAGSAVPPSSMGCIAKRGGASASWSSGDPLLILAINAAAPAAMNAHMAQRAAYSSAAAPASISGRRSRAAGAGRPAMSFMAAGASPRRARCDGRAHAMVCRAAGDAAAASAGAEARSGDAGRLPRRSALAVAAAAAAAALLPARAARAFERAPAGARPLPLRSGFCASRRAANRGAACALLLARADAPLAQATSSGRTPWTATPSSTPPTGCKSGQAPYTQPCALALLRI